jgi:hypothetical protein
VLRAKRDAEEKERREAEERAAVEAADRAEQAAIAIALAKLRGEDTTAAEAALAAGVDGEGGAAGGGGSGGHGNQKGAAAAGGAGTGEVVMKQVEANESTRIDLLTLHGALEFVRTGKRERVSCAAFFENLETYNMM